MRYTPSLRDGFDLLQLLADECDSVRDKLAFFVHDTDFDGALPATLDLPPYWQTYLDVTPLGGTQKQVYWALSFGSRTDTKLLAQLKMALTELKEAEP